MLYLIYAKWSTAAAYVYVLFSFAGQNENNNSAQRAAAELAESEKKMSTAQEKSMKKG